MNVKIGIIGAGIIGGTFAGRLAALGHEVPLNMLAKLAAETVATAVSVVESARSAELVVVTVPEINVPDLPGGLLKGTPSSVVVVETGNYLPRQRDGCIDEIEAGTTECRWVEKQLGRPVVKVNNIYAEYARPHP